ncbi:hypothetical protein FGO68_gene2478 [Halteria grandinella]|uniref:Uncharacterized protein n=1 Tax=Halteria grandinella TaxID=5974 RepID=A0A8J8P1E0_HALGN|nr:hypothetical protein FGO68_gene2478 [Halteria grandinella]
MMTKLKQCYLELGAQVYGVNAIISESGYCNEKTSMCDVKPDIPDISDCDYQPIKYECFDDFRINAVSQSSQRCENVQCYCDYHCKSGNCQNQKCTTWEKPACNVSLTYTFCDKKNLSQILYEKSTNLCEGVFCSCDSDCFTNTCQGYNKDLKTCSAIKRETMTCNQSTSICLNDASGEFLTINRCENVLCFNNNECQSGYCNVQQLLCQNQTDLVCNRTQYNQEFKNGRWQNIGQMENLCYNTQCDCDNQCTQGTYCDQLRRTCMPGGRSSISCNESLKLCEYDYQPNSIFRSFNSSNRCNTVQCQCDQDCQSNYCSPVQKTCLPSINLGTNSTSCNHTGLTCGIPMMNKCLESPCDCDNECESGYCNKLCKDNSTLVSQKCDQRANICETNFETGVQRKLDSTQKCDDVQCECHSECRSGFCGITVGTSQGMCMIKPQKCNQTFGLHCIRFGQPKEFLKNLCDGTTCAWNGDCASGYCAENAKLCRDSTLRDPATCNSSLQIPSGRNYFTGEVMHSDTQGRCLGVKCSMDKQCQKGLCKEGNCSDCNLYPLRANNLCPHQMCEDHSQCSHELCIDNICVAKNDCNSTIKFQSTNSTNRCIDTQCEYDQDCQIFAICKENACKLKAKYSLGSSSDQGFSNKQLIILIACLAAALLLIAFGIIIGRYYYLKRKVVISVKKNNVILTTEKAMIDESVLSSMDQSTITNATNLKIRESAEQGSQKQLDQTNILQF